MVLYCSVDQEVAEPIVAEFEKVSGIRVLARYDTEASKTVGLVQKLRAEAAAPAADVFWSSEAFHTIRLAREGLLTPYHSDATKNWPKPFVDARGLWYGFALRGRAIAYDTRRTSPDQAPRRLEDLLDARWKGRIVMATPRFGTTGGDVASWFAHYGPNRAKEILRALQANAVRVVSSNSTAVREVANGKADVCLTDTDDVYAAQRNGWPIAMNPLDQDGKGALAIPNTAALIRGAPHAAQAKELMAFLLSQRVEEMLARSDSHNTSIRPAVAERFAQYRVGKPLAIDYDKVADALPGAVQAAGEILH